MSIFTSLDDAVQELRTDRLPLLSFALPVTFTDAALRQRILAAEADVSRRINAKLEPTEVFPEAPTADQITALDGTPYVVESGYDLPDDFFLPGVWGGLRLKNRPVLAVDSMVIRHAALPGTNVTIPPEWITFDSKAGLVTILPGATSIGMLPVSLYALTMYTAGTTLPAIIRMRYRCGVDRSDPVVYPLQDLVLRLAVARIVGAAMVPGSESVSADGLSQSRSFNLKDTTDLIYAELQDLRDQLTGPVYGVL